MIEYIVCGWASVDSLLHVSDTPSSVAISIAACRFFARFLDGRREMSIHHRKSCVVNDIMVQE